jgi:catalase
MTERKTLTTSQGMPVASDLQSMTAGGHGPTLVQDAHLRGAQKKLQLRQSALFYKADPDYGTRVAKGLELDLDEVKRLAAMSQEDRVRATLE